MNETTDRITIAGRTYEFTHANAALPLLTLGGRLVMGFFFIWSGFDKLFNDFSSVGWLLNVTQGPLKDIFIDLGESQTAVDIVDPLVIWGQIFIGISLLLGLFTRVGAFMGALQMALIYLAILWPEHNPVVDDHLIYVGIFALLGALGAGRIFGLDYFIEKTATVRKRPLLKYLLG